MTANDHLVGDAAVGAVSVMNDRDNVGVRRGPGGFNKEDALVLTAEAAAMLIVDNAYCGNVLIALVCSAFEDMVAREGTTGGSGVGTTTMTMGGGGGNYANYAGAILDNDSCC
jgi:hypothetical protein